MFLRSYDVTYKVLTVIKFLYIRGKIRFHIITLSIYGFIEEGKKVILDKQNGKGVRKTKMRAV